MLDGVNEHMTTDGIIGTKSHLRATEMAHWFRVLSAPGFGSLNLLGSSEQPLIPALEHPLPSEGPVYGAHKFTQVHTHAHEKILDLGTPR